MIHSNPKGDPLESSGGDNRLLSFVRSIRQPSARARVIAVLASMILFVSWLDWATGPGREPADLYYIPIFLSAGAFGPTGVAVTVGVSSVLYCLTLSLHHVPYVLADVSQILLFLVLGLAVAQLATEYLRADGLRSELLHLNAELSQRVAAAVAAEREAQQKLRDNQRLRILGQAAATIAHEIKNPLVAIGGFTSRIKRQLTRDHPAQPGLDTVIQEVARLESLLKELLDLGSPGRRDNSRVNLCVLVDEVLSLAQPPIQENKVQLVSVLPSEPLTTLGDADNLKRALLNVVLNGVEAMPGGGKLAVKVCNASKGVERGAAIVVQDSGNGIPPDHLQKIFEPFFTTKRGGTGLGLAVVKKTIDAHGGTVMIESRPDEGTIVTLWLPAHEADPVRSGRAGEPQAAEE